MLKLLAVLISLASPAELTQGGGQTTPAPIRPSFSGKWANEFSSAADTTARSQWSQPLTITQDAKTLTIEYVSYGRSHAPVKLVYNLDGSTSKGVDMNSGPYDLLLRAEWRDKQLVLNTVYLRSNYGNIEITEMLTLESPDTMRVEVTRQVGDRTLTGTARWRR